MWKYIKGKNLNGAHNSLVDVKVQTDILINKMFVGFINRTTSIQTVDTIFNTTQKTIGGKRWNLSDLFTLHGWSKQRRITLSGLPRRMIVIQALPEDPNLDRQCRFKALLCRHVTLQVFFLQYCRSRSSPVSKVAEFTNNYCFEDWVVEKMKLDSDGNLKKRPYLETVPTSTNGEPTSGRRHCADKQRVKWLITPGFIICWVAILILQGTHFGSDKKLLRENVATSSLWY